jgi:ABC-type multidrug transport system ATPase subunit
MIGQTLVLHVQKVGKRFGDREILRGIDAGLGPGERLGLSGPNGSGKTTLLRCVAGTLTPTTGTVTIGGHPADSVAARSLTGGALAHEGAFYQRLSGYQNLMFYASLRSPGAREARANVESLVEELELEAFVRETVSRYSSGMFQQLGLARALLGEPALLVLDEPTRSLDEAAVDRFWQAIDRRAHAAVVMASHRRSDLDRCSQRIELS